jgi:predicted ATPase/class 3 adenylate cyclase
MDFALAHHEAVRRALPSGTVTFLFTDVEGSTKLLHELGAEAYAEALAEHRRIVRDAVAAHGGVEVDTQGDAFFVAFPTAPGALAAAGAALEDHSRGPIRVRMGIHTGTPHVAEEGYVGADVHRAARIAACGHGGQVVVSASTASLVDAAGLRELGRHRLKDFDEPVSLYQLGTERFPPLKTISNTNLPHPASSFVGREKEVEEVAALLRDRARLVTLTGPGGSGKTRLALEAAGELVPAFTAGVFWIGLAPLRDPALVAETIAKTLGAQDGLAAHIGEGELLLLLDNLEQVVEAAPELASLVETCPNLRLLVTSRELLRVRGEVEYPVLPLAEPEAVELFCARAQTDPEETVGELCRALDNLPLALELAAARASVLSPRQILERLSGRLDLLKGGRDADPRQQTLRATIEWSYELLAPKEQRLFARLAVFRGGCTLKGAEEVADADLDRLQSLVDKSLLRHSAERFWMLETIREYVAERLEASGEAEELRRRHGDYFLALAEEADPGLGVEHEWLDWLAPEHDNMRAALDRYEASGEAELALRLAAAVWRFWNLRGYITEGRRRLEAALAADPRPTAARAKALYAAAVMAGNAGDAATARLRIEEGLALCRELGDVGGIAAAEYVLGHNALDEGDLDRARRFFEASVRRSREVGDEHSVIVTADSLAWVYDHLGDRERARALTKENLRQARALGSKRIEAYSLCNLAMHALHERRFQDALTLLKESLRIHRDRAVAWDIAEDLQRFGRVLAAAGRAETAARLLSSGEAQLEEAGYRRARDIVGCEEAIADIRAHLDEAAIGHAWQEGRKLTVEEAVALALDS